MIEGNCEEPKADHDIHLKLLFLTPLENSSYWSTCFVLPIDAIIVFSRLDNETIRYVPVPL